MVLFDLFDQYFTAVVETGSFTRAAEQLYVSQPAVSRQIATAEKKFGFTLFQRTSRSVQLTPQGEIVYRALRQMEHAISEARQIRTDLQGELRIALLNGWSLRRLPTHAFDRFQKKYPNVELVVELLTYREMNRRLLGGSLDLIFTNRRELAEHPQLQYRHAFSVPLYLILAKTHPLADTANDVAHLGEMNLYVMNEEVSVSTVRFAQRLVRENGWGLQVVPKPNFESILHAVDRHMGCAMGCYSTYTNALPDYLSFDTGAAMDTVCAWNPEIGSEAVEALLMELSPEAETEQPGGKVRAVS